MISFSIDKQRGQVNVEWMSRPIDTNKKINKNQSLVLALTSMEQSPTFASRLKRKLLSGPILRGAYNCVFPAMGKNKKTMNMQEAFSTLNKLPMTFHFGFLLPSVLVIIYL